MKLLLCCVAVGMTTVAATAPNLLAKVLFQLSATCFLFVAMRVK